MALRSPFLAINFVVFHAPQPKHSKGGIANFFAELTSILLGLTNGLKFVFMADANATLGKIQDDSIGSDRPASEDAAGKCFHQLLLRFNMFVPSTFQHIVKQQSTASFGNKRIDYVCLPSCWKENCDSAGSHQAIAEQTAKTEHVPVFANISHISSQSHKTRLRGVLPP